MPSLSEKRLLHYANRHNTHSNKELSDINLNTDELEAKLDTIIANTSHNEFTGSSTTIVAPHSTDTTISVVDLGAVSAPHKINIVGTSTHNNIDNIIQVSNDNITFFDLPQIAVSSIGTKISGIGDICFRYFRMKTTDNTGTPTTIVIEYSVKNIN